MALLRFFNVPKHQRFTYKPRYWDPDQEQLDERMKRIKDIQEKGVEASKARISGGFRQGFKGNQQYRRSQVRRSNMILFFIIAILIFLTYLFLKDLGPEITSTFN
jgi:hypothetical protein